MPVALISDTHMPKGGRALPPACIERLASAELIIHAGDIAASEVLAEMEAIGPPVLAVAGNVDTPELQHRLPATRMVERDGFRVAVVHDAGPSSGRLRRLRRRFPDADAVVFSHLHIRLLVEGDGFHIFNPGSPTERRRSPHHTMGVLESGADGLVFAHVELD